jgi:predicted dehydrogenase
MSHDLDLAHMPQLPADRSAPIGVVGAGFIVDDIQLVAYREAGFDVRAIASRSPERARDVASRHGIPKVHDTWQELVADEELQIIDVAFPPELQPEIVMAAAEQPHVRGILTQKPMALDHATGLRTVEACEAADTLLAVNVNMRFDQSIRAVKTLLTRGELGTPVLATIEMRAIPHWQPFLEGTDRLTLQNMSIHHLDAFRYLLGDPDGIYVSARTDPRTTFAHRDGICLSTLEWDSGVRASAWDDVWTGPVREGSEGDVYIKWRVEGTEGVAWGTIGWPSYPNRTPSTLHFASTARPHQIVSPVWPEVWFPDAFAGTMGELIGATQGAPLTISGRDNLQTLALLDAGYRSIEEKRLVRVEEITGGLVAASTGAATAAS